MEGLRQLDETQRLRGGLGARRLGPARDSSTESECPEPAARVLEALTTPRTLSELLDEVHAARSGGDRGADRLARSGSGAAHRVERGAGRAGRRRAHGGAVGAGQARGPQRLSRRGARGGGRDGARLVTLMHAIARIADAVVPTETVPAAPVPYALATLRLGEADLEVMGLPLVEAYAPLWGLVLPGAAALARIELTASEALDTRLLGRRRSGARSRRAAARRRRGGSRAGGDAAAHVAREGARWLSRREARVKQRIAVIAGDGIGPEVIAEALLVLEQLRQRARPRRWRSGSCRSAPSSTCGRHHISARAA